MLSEFRFLEDGLGCRSVVFHRFQFCDGQFMTELEFGAGNILQILREGVPLDVRRVLMTPFSLRPSSICVGTQEDIVCKTVLFFLIVVVHKVFVKCAAVGGLEVISSFRRSFLPEEVCAI